MGYLGIGIYTIVIMSYLGIGIYTSVIMDYLGSDLHFSYQVLSWNRDLRYLSWVILE